MTLLLSLTATVPAAVANPIPAPWRVITKITYFAGLITTFGGAMLYLIVLRPVLRRPAVPAADRELLLRRFSIAAAIAGTWYLVALYFQIAGKAARVAGTSIPYGQALSPAAIGNYVNVPAKKSDWISSGQLTLAQYVLWGLASVLLMLLFAPRLRRRPTGLVVASLVVSFTGYQVTVLPTNFAKWPVATAVDSLLDHTHVMAASTWVGGIATLVALVFLTRKGVRGAATWPLLWARFSTLALVAVGCLLVSGLYLAYTYIGSPSELFTTAFGHVLLIKLCLVASMIALGGANEFVLMPRIARARAAGDDAGALRLAVRRFPLLVAAEVVLAVGVLCALSFLTGSARVQEGQPDPTLSANVIGLGALFAAVVAISFVTTAKVSHRLARTDTAATSTGSASPALPSGVE
jgi:putative copper export protein